MACELKQVWSRVTFTRISLISCTKKGVCRTNKQLSVEIQAGVAIGRSFQEAQGKLVHLQRRLLHVPLSSDVMPLLIVQRNVGLHRQDERTVSDIKQERHCRWS